MIITNPQAFVKVLKIFSPMLSKVEPYNAVCYDYQHNSLIGSNGYTVINKNISSISDDALDAPIYFTKPIIKVICQFVKKHNPNQLMITFSDVNSHVSISDESGKTIMFSLEIYLRVSPSLKYLRHLLNYMGGDTINNIIQLDVSDVSTICKVFNSTKVSIDFVGDDRYRIISLENPYDVAIVSGLTKTN